MCSFRHRSVILFFFCEVPAFFFTLDFKYLPITVISNGQVPLLRAVSLTSHITIVKPTAYCSLDLTTLPLLSLQTIVVGLIVSMLSMADGDGVQATTEPDVPGSTNPETLPGHVRIGPSLSEIIK